MVPGSETLRKIHSEFGVTGSFKDRVIAEWLQKYKDIWLEYQQAVDNFTLSLQVTADQEGMEKETEARPFLLGHDVAALLQKSMDKLKYPLSTKVPCLLW
ncbi:hypothetical protein CEXT_564011 [Caerostris extrusa]|uniref:Uncharacterized protein n=1 Tax=Caerostris extrusa TaxID=172846 RepID=A0AAV4NC74_CAEEX|nr:hypothetical protein CEXT_564011 [Caerostris extrusa]